MLNKELQLDIPTVESILCVVQTRIEVMVTNENKIKESYTTIPFHFMVYKKNGLFQEGIVYECACLELGRFHIIGSDTNKIQQKFIDQVIKEHKHIIADHIIANVFREKNDALIKALNSSMMDDFWHVYKQFEQDTRDKHLQIPSTKDKLLKNRYESSMDLLTKQVA